MKGFIEYAYENKIKNKRSADADISAVQFSDVDEIKNSFESGSRVLHVTFSNEYNNRIMNSLTRIPNVKFYY